MFTKEGVVELPFDSYTATELPEVSERLTAPFEATHPMMGNLAIVIDGAAARSRQYLLAAHVLRADDLSIHANVGGWYDFHYRPVADVWKVSRCQLSVVYSGGIPFEPTPEKA